MWSVGCIIAEMVLMGKPLFTGDGEIDQIRKIFRCAPLPSAHGKTLIPCSVLGAHDDLMLPGVGVMPDERSPKPLASVIPGLDDNGYDVLKVSSYDRSFRFPRLTAPHQQTLRNTQADRISAKRMKRHPWFDSYRETLPRREI